MEPTQQQADPLQKGGLGRVAKKGGSKGKAPFLPSMAHILDPLHVLYCFRPSHYPVLPFHPLGPPRAPILPLKNTIHCSFQIHQTIHRKSASTKSSFLPFFQFDSNMALANPRQIQTSPAAIHPSSMPILDHQNLLLLANSSAPISANLLFSGQSSLNQIHSSNVHHLLSNNQNDLNSQQIHFKMECNENLDESAIPLPQSQQFSIAMKEQSNLATITSLASASASTHSTQQFLDQTILELLLAKSNALSLLSQSLLLPNFVPFLPTSTAPTLQPNTFMPIPLRMDSIIFGNMEHHGNEIVGGNDQKIIHQLDNQMDSLSRNKLGRSYNPGRPLGMLDRQKILELYQKGLKISHIAKVIGVTHSCVSKIMTRYRRTGSIHPRSAQLSLLSRRQPSMNPSSNGLILPNSPKIPTIQFWPQCLNEGKDENALKCSFPSAFQRICGINSDEEKEGNGGRGNGNEDEDGQKQQEQKKEQKPYLVERLLF